MSIFDDISSGFESVAETVKDTVVSGLNEVSHLPDRGLGMINEMRGVAGALPFGFPAASFLTGVEDVVGHSPMGLAATGIGNIISKSPFSPGVPDAGSLKGLENVLENLAANPFQHNPLEGIGPFGKLLGNQGDAVALNPQPLPPGPDDFRALGRILSALGDNLAALNPQPLPPGPDGNLARIFSRIGESKALNPQPLPPGPEVNLAKIFSRIGESKALNPQPLPPGPDGNLANIFSRIRDVVALNPQPLPPGPDGNIGKMFAGIGDIAALNPQPLPPGPDGNIGKMFAGIGDIAALNPQPLPPGPDGNIGKMFAGIGDIAALNPQPLPPKALIKNLMSRNLLRAR